MGRASVPRLIYGELAASGQSHGGEPAPALIVNLAANPDTLVAELGQGRIEVGAHQVQRMLSVLAGVHRELAGRQGENQPAASHVNRFETKDVANESTVGIRVRAFDDRVRTDEHLHRISIVRLVTD